MHFPCLVPHSEQSERSSQGVLSWFHGAASRPKVCISDSPNHFTIAFWASPPVLPDCFIVVKAILPVHDSPRHFSEQKRASSPPPPRLRCDTPGPSLPEKTIHGKPHVQNRVMGLIHLSNTVHNVWKPALKFPAILIPICGQLCSQAHNLWLTLTLPDWPSQHPLCAHELLTGNNSFQAFMSEVIICCIESSPPG